MRQINENLKNNIEKGMFNKDNIEIIIKKRISIYLYAEDIVHEVSRADWLKRWLYSTNATYRYVVPLFCSV